MSNYEKLITANGYLWTLCKLRKPATCFATGEQMMVGEEAYRPITNGSDRMKRMKPHLSHMKDRS
jgi:hypothetical protein